jgi:hypothetical protein
VNLQNQEMANYTHILDKGVNQLHTCMMKFVIVETMTENYPDASKEQRLYCKLEITYLQACICHTSCIVEVCIACPLQIFTK